MKPARYIFLNKGLGMSAGKCAAQAAHAETLAVTAFWEEIARRPDYVDDPPKGWDLWDQWFGHGHYAKYVMEAQDSIQMYTLERYLEARGFRTYTVIDEGHTEATYFVPTAMSVELVDKENERTASIFGEFRLYKDEPRSVGGRIGTEPVGGFSLFRRRKNRDAR